MTITQLGLGIITRYEGCKLEAYHDCVGILTIGYGSTDNVYDGMRITFDEAVRRLQQHLAPIEKQIERLVTVPLSQAQFDALCSFIYNLGIGVFEKSTLLKLLNEGEYAKAADEFDKYCHAGGKVVQGLVKRRADEKKLFLQT